MTGSLGEYPCLSQFVRKMRGSSQPILARANDGLFYVVKFLNNLQGPNVLFNESVGNELYKACGLAGPSWTPLAVTDAFLDKNRNCWIEMPEGRLRPSAGLCFASRFLWVNGARLWEIVPGSSFCRIHNRNQFWLAWLIDSCAGHADNRQAIFVKDAEGMLNTFFIDHGHLLLGPEGNLDRPSSASRYLDSRIYEGVTSKYLLDLKKIARSIDADKLRQGARELPDEWKTPSAIEALEQCLGRISSGQFVSDILDVFVNSIPRTIELEDRKRARSVLRPGVPRAQRRNRCVA